MNFYEFDQGGQALETSFYADYAQQPSDLGAVRIVAETTQNPMAFYFKHKKPSAMCHL